MNRVPLSSVALSACLLLAAWGAGAPAAVAADTAVVNGSAKVVTLVERATTDAVTDTGEKGDSNGDLLTWSNELFDAANAKKVGTDQGYCVRVAKGVSWECTWTNTLADGSITVAGSFLDKGDSTLAITGGTGAYAGARGFMRLHPRNPEASEYDFTFEILN